MATLLVVILISFIGVGIPDSIMGTAWPAIYRELNLPLSLAGYISSTASVATILSSLMSPKLSHRFGTGLVTAGSTLLTAIALLGFSFSHHVVFLFLLALPLGFGAGAIDTVLNSFVALHYKASHMSFLHCFYGVGVAASPFIMSIALGDGENWRRGYFIVAIIQFAITMISFLALPLWHKAQQKDVENNQIKQKPISFFSLIKDSTVRKSCFAFFCSCSLELTAGAWSSTYFVNTKGFHPGKAALITTLLYLGLTAGRLLSGIFSGRLGRRRILRISLYLLFVALFFFAFPFPLLISASALFLIGLGVGPIFPNLVHLTPKIFGEEKAESVMAAQQVLSYLGVMLAPWIFGILAENISISILPYFLIVAYLFYAAAFLTLMKKSKAAKQN